MYAVPRLTLVDTSAACLLLTLPANLLFSTQAEQLTSVTLSGCALNAVHIECLVPLLLACPALETLDLSHNKLGEVTDAESWTLLFSVLEVRDEHAAFCSLSVPVIHAYSTPIAKY